MVAGQKIARTANSTYKKLAVQWLNLPTGRQVKLSRKGGTGRASYQVFPQRRDKSWWQTV